MKLALVVDDYSQYRKDIKEVLEEYDFKVIEATNGLEAYNMYVENKPDLVTMDINMPVLDGFESIKKIIEYDKEAKILICSSMMFLDVFVAEGLMAGAKACICKPFTKNQLIDAINEVILGG